MGGAALCAVVILGHLLVDEVWTLVGLRLLLGVAEAFFFVAGFAMLADLAPPGRTGEALSFNSLALYGGIAIGPVLGQALLDLWGFDWVWIGAATLVVVATALALRLPETLEGRGEGTAPTHLFHRAVLVPGLALLTGVAAMAAYFAFASLRAAEIGLHAWSVVLFLIGAVVVTCRIAFAKVPDRHAPLPLAVAALGLCAAGLTASAVLDSVAGLLAGAALLAVGIAFLTPAIFTMVFTVVPPHERGAASGTASVFIDLGLGGGPMALGFVAASGGTPAAFLAAAALAAVGALTMVTLGPRRVVV